MKSVLYAHFPESDWYKIFRYPQGETQVRLEREALSMIEGTELVVITARISNGEDLIALLHLMNAFRGVGRERKYRLILPYLPYSRADRRFVPGDTLGLEVMASLLNLMGFERIVTLDVHNAVEAKRLIPRLVDVSAQEEINRSIVDFAHYYERSKVTVLFPDKGAADRYNQPAQVASNVEVIEVQTLFAQKKRNPTTGAFEGFEVPEEGQFETDAVLIVDDLCDGGGTFNGIADVISGRGQEVTLGLYVSHGIYSKGLTELTKRFKQLYTTNSIRERDPISTVPMVADVMPALMAEAIK